MDTTTIIFYILVFAVLYAIEIPQCYWYRFEHYWWPDNIQPKNNAFKNKHINSFSFIRNLLNGSNSVSLTKDQAKDLDGKFTRYYPKRRPGTITILSTRPSFKDYKHFFGNCYYTENAVKFYDYMRRKIVERNQRLFVSFADRDGKNFEVHMLNQNRYWWLLILYKGSMILPNFIWLCIRMLYSLSISILSRCRS
ncbi:uncharacterized protein LOC107363005 [Tetranychus urticae]|uniref:Uncharacterized protein n=1 Tax=Tetranychus urticae TaxID=32264 RepID=T1L3J0_TETUR|nr:uncharacterized protein LOC107363005 [Tetranychus urticae]